jgi:GT2 family glycosyltransferase
MKKSSVSLIITSYHLDEEMAELTRKCIASLKYGRPDEVILVDDASPLQVEFEGIDRHVKRLENGGFPKCANTGWKAANGDILILSNNDVEYTPGWLEGILKPLNEGYDISSIRVSDSDGWTVEDYIEEDGTFGSLWAMKREVYEKIGGFDESFDKGTFEDKDFALRAREAGFRIGKYHGALVEHVGRATMDKLYPNQEDFYEGQAKYLDKHGKLD